MKVTRGQHIEAGGREESGSQLTWREEGSSLLAWRRQERRPVLAWRRGDKESLLSWRRSWTEDGCHMCRVASAQRRLGGADRWQEMEQPGSCHAGAYQLLKHCYAPSPPPQIFPTFLVAGLGMVAAGLVLNLVQAWPVFTKASLWTPLSPSLLDLFQV